MNHNTLTPTELHQGSRKVRIPQYLTGHISTLSSNPTELLILITQCSRDSQSLSKAKVPSSICSLFLALLLPHSTTIPTSSLSLCHRCPHASQPPEHCLPSAPGLTGAQG